jgi:hypothetical protein
VAQGSKVNYCVTLLNGGEVALQTHHLVIPGLGIDQQLEHLLAPGAFRARDRGGHPALGGVTIAATQTQTLTVRRRIRRPTPPTPRNIWWRPSSSRRRASARQRCAAAGSRRRADHGEPAVSAKRRAVMYFSFPLLALLIESASIGKENLMSERNHHASSWRRDVVVMAAALAVVGVLLTLAAMLVGVLPALAQEEPSAFLPLILRPAVTATPHHGDGPANGDADRAAGQRRCVCRAWAGMTWECIVITAISRTWPCCRPTTIFGRK